MPKKKHKPAPAPVKGSMALWLCTPFGLLMPAAVPPEVAAKLPEGTVQVRARDAHHLAAFRDAYCPELGPIAQTPQLDYDCRAYCLKEDLARALARMALDIDGSKFKPLTHGPFGLADKVLADRLHSVYNAMWGAALRLSPAKEKDWATPSSYTVVATPDANASLEVCSTEGSPLARWHQGRCRPGGSLHRLRRASQYSHREGHLPGEPQAVAGQGEGRVRCTLTCACS